MSGASEEGRVHNPVRGKGHRDRQSDGREPEANGTGGHILHEKGGKSMRRTDPNFRKDIAVVSIGLVAILCIVLTDFCFLRKKTEPAAEERPEPEVIIVTVEVERKEPEPEPEEEPVCLGEFTVTAYCPCVKCCGKWSAQHPSRGADYVQMTTSGTIPEEGRTVAADWSVIPSGTKIEIDGHTYTVEDTGSAVKGNHIDMFFEDHQKAIEWGVQTHKVFAVKEEEN